MSPLTPGSDRHSDVAASGCYKCGEPVREFGGFVSPGVVDFLTGRCFPQVARWWTKCKDCGYVEVRS